MIHEVDAEFAADYALGMLEGDDRVRFEVHLRRGCRDCQTAVSEYERSLAALVAELSPVTPPPSLKAALLSRVAVEGRPPRRALPWRRTVRALLYRFFQ